jgi:uncharacterized membrane protein
MNQEEKFFEIKYLDEKNKNENLLSELEILKLNYEIIEKANQANDNLRPLKLYLIFSLCLIFAFKDEILLTILILFCFVNCVK